MKGRVACMRSIAPVLLLFLPHSSTEFLIGNGTWAVFDVSSQENGLVFARFSLLKFRLYLLSTVTKNRWASGAMGNIIDLSIKKPVRNGTRFVRTASQEPSSVHLSDADFLAPTL